MTGLDPDPAVLVRDLAAIGTEPEERFMRITRTASAIVGTRAAVIALLDGEHQWIMGCVGVENATVARDETLCRHAVARGSLFVVPDLRADPHFAAHDIVTDRGFRFFAGQPLLVRGHVVGTLCLLDYHVRDLSRTDRDRIADLACWAETEILAVENELNERRTAAVTAPLRQEYAQRGGDRRAVERLKDEFVSVVSHELRTPLTSIRGSLGLLASGRFGELPAQGVRLVQIALDNTERLVRLVNDILDLERIKAGRSDMHPRVQPLIPLLEAARDAVAGAAEEVGVTVTTSSPPIWASVDADFLVRAFTNLIGNAVKFSPPGRTVTVDASRDSGEIRISVADRGRGIPADRLDRIFERFEQVDASDSREKGGSGLGLAITRSIVERHSGRIEVVSELDVGSTFTVVLPAPQVVTPRAEDDRAGQASVVIVVDDDDLVDVLTAALAQEGVQTASARGVEEAVALVTRLHPALVVLDVQLADGDGYQVVAQLRADPTLAATPLVVATVYDLDDHERARLTLGATTLVTKAAAGSDLVATVLAAVRQHVAPGGDPVSEASEWGVRGASDSWVPRTRPVSGPSDLEMP